MILKKRALITWLIVICYVVLTLLSCTNSQEDTDIHEETDLSEETSSLPEEKPETSTIPQEHVSTSQTKSIIIPSGYLELTVSPAEVYANIGEQIEIRCTIEFLVNTPVDISSIETVLFDSSDFIVRKKLMILESHDSAYIKYTIVGDEAFYRLKVDFTTPIFKPGLYSEYTSASFPILVN